MHRIRTKCCHCSNFSINRRSSHNHSFKGNVLIDAFIEVGFRSNCTLCCTAIRHLGPNLFSTISSNRLSKFVRCRIISSWRFLLLNWIAILYGTRCLLLDLRCHTSSKMLHRLVVCSFTILVRIISCMGRENDQTFYLFWRSLFDSQLANPLCNWWYIELNFWMKSVVWCVPECLDRAREGLKIMLIWDRQKPVLEYYWLSQWWNTCFFHDWDISTRSSCIWWGDCLELKAIYWKRYEEYSGDWGTLEFKSQFVCSLSSSHSFSRLSSFFVSSPSSDSIFDGTPKLQIQVV